MCYQGKKSLEILTISNKQQVEVIKKNDLILQIVAV